MIEVRQTREFVGWLHHLRDANAVARIRRMEMGNPGDTRSVGQGILENAHRLWAELAHLLSASRSANRDPAMWWEQAHAAEGYFAGSKAGGDVMMPKTTRFDATDYL